MKDKGEGIRDKQRRDRVRTNAVFVIVRGIKDVFVARDRGSCS
jgi:hypothetical protein